MRLPVLYFALTKMHDLDIGPGKIISLEQQGLAHVPGEGIGTAIPKIEPCRMVALAESAIGFTSKDYLLQGEIDDIDTGNGQ